VKIPAICLVIAVDKLDIRKDLLEVCVLLGLEFELALPKFAKSKPNLGEAGMRSALNCSNHSECL
jgi:hypothetical protein